MAATFTSLGGFADVRGTGVATEYLSERDGVPGTSGWTTHAITPRQAPMTFLAALMSLDPLYEGDMSEDLTRAVFRAWSPLTGEANVQDNANLYRRSDLRSPGSGTYDLVTTANSPLPPITFTPFSPRPYFADASADFEHLLFESRLNLTSDASGLNAKLYKWDLGALRLVAPGPTCPGALNPLAPCSSAGVGAAAARRTDRTISNDGSRAFFTSPLTAANGVSTRAGAVSRLYELDDQHTVTREDDALLQLNASEKASPDIAQAARFETASLDGSRVLFTSTERLTDGASVGGGLYLWERKADDELQQIAIDATAGTFTLTTQSQPSTGSGTLTAGDSTITDVTGSFAVGQVIHGNGIPEGTVIIGLRVGSTTTLTLSQPASVTGAEELAASVERTTEPVPYNAPAAAVETALENLPSIGIGNVAVSGGPGTAAPMTVRFTGALSGVNVMPLTADASGLSGGTASVQVDTTNPVHNLTLIGPAATGVMGSSDDAHHVYFVAPQQLVSDGPAISNLGIYYWTDGGSTGRGGLSFVGEIDFADAVANVNQDPWHLTRKLARVSSDGQHLMFGVSSGGGLAPRYDHGVNCPGGSPNSAGGGCTELYVYDAEHSSPLSPVLLCASCRPDGGLPTGSAYVNIRSGSSGSQSTWHLNRALSDDGRHVFFSTAEPLVADDVNGKFDAYEFDVPTRAVHLLSTGRDASDSYFLEASRSGDDAFFVTRERLLGWDRDQAYDLYDARVGGGFPEPPADQAPCAQDGCQGALPSAPAPSQGGSSRFRGLGNFSPRSTHRAAKRCKRGYVRHRVRGRRRCIKRRRHAVRRTRRHG